MTVRSRFSGCIFDASYSLVKFLSVYYLSRDARKEDFRRSENKGADQRLCFRYTDSTIPFLHKSEISSFLTSSVTVQAGLCQTWSEPQIFGFPMHRLFFFVAPLRF